MYSWQIKTTKYRATVTVNGADEVHEAIQESDRSPWPESSAECSCGFRVGPKRRGALSELLDHFRELGIEVPEVVR